jgi:two-component system NarL family sensor kinase
MVDEFRANTPSLSVAANIAPALPQLSEEQQSALFHIAQEALVNVRKHASARSLSIALRADVTALRLTICDDGAGFQVDGDRPEQHRGLRNMASRAAAAGAELRVQSAEGAGTTIEVQLPISARERVTA